MKKSLLTILCTLLSTISWAQGTTAGDSTAVAEPYAVLSADSLTVTFYYDNQKSARGGMDINNSYIDDGNSSPYGTATMAVFDASFANYLPTSTAYWFQRCNLLTEIRGLSNLNSANVTNMRFMFDNCSSLTNLDMSGFNTTNVTDMVLLFAGCSALTSLDLSGLNTTNVTEMNWMFDGCSSLTSLDVSGFNTANVTNMSGMFHECSSLTSLDLSGFNTANVTNMSWMFERCSALTNIYVSSTWTTSQVTANNGSNMFNECVNLVGGAGTTFSADHTDYTYAHIDGGTSNPGYFTDKNAAPVVDEDLKDDVYTVGETDFSTEFYTQFSKYYQIPQGGKWVSKFKLNLNPNDNRIYKNFVLLITNDEDRGAGQYKEYGAFRYDAVADSTRTNSQWGTSYVFPFQYTTSTLYLEPDENEMDPNVQKLGGLVTLTVDRSQADAFVITMSNEQGVVKTYHQPYVLPNFNNDSTNSNIRCYITVENSQLEFKGSNIEPIGGYTAPVATVEPYAVLKGDTLLTFYYDDQKEARNGMSVGPFDNYDNVSWYANRGTITKVVFDESFANCTSLTSTAYWFRGMSALTTIEGIINLKTDNVTSMGSMFYGCSGLTSLDVSGFNTDNVTSMSEMFAGCSGLKTIYAGNETLVSVNDFSTMPDQPFPYYTMGVEPPIINGAMHYESDGNYNQFIIFPGGNNQLTEGNYVVRLYMASNKDADGVQLTVQNGWGDDAQNFTLPVPVVAGDHVYELKLPGLTGTPSTGYDCILKPQTAECILDVKKIEFYKLEYSAVVNWNTDNVTKGTAMFDGCTNLVGGAGTVYDANHTDHTYAHIDGGVSNPGYFTDKNASYNEAYAVLVSEDGGNIMYATLYYDGNKANHTEGFAVVGLDEMLQNQAWMMNRSNIKTVNFNESFANCNPTSTAYWFAFCNSLTAINGLQYLNTEFVTNMDYMFSNCSALTSIDLSHFRAKSLTSMNSMFSGCSLLTSLDLSGFFTFTVTSMSKLFAGCTNLKTIYVNKYDWSTESVTAGDDVFEGCTSLVGGAGTTFNDSHIDYTYARIDGGPNSTTPGYFTDKDATSKVATPTFSWNEHTLTVSSATEGATIVYNNLKENPVMVEGEGILLYHTYTYTDPLTIIENAKLLFWAQKDGMANSDSITLNYPYTAWVALTDTLTKAKGIYDLALNNANVPDQMKSELASAISIGDSIYQVRNSSVDEIQSVTNRISVIANEVASLISAEDEPYAVLSENNTILTFYYDKQKTARHGVDMLGWQSTSETITTVNFDTSFAGYRPTSTQGWFAACYALTTINGMENLVTDDVTTMDGMFEVCRSLTNLNLTTFNTANVTSMYMMFRNCSSLTTVDLSSFNTAKVANMSCMFMDNSVLTTIYIGSGWSTAAVTSGDYVFSGCTNLMGGAGTSYDANHVDYTYARIDGGPDSQTPGYFTDKNAPITVAAPEFRFEGDNLTMTTETQNAGIFYKVADLPSMDDAVVESVVNSLIVTADGQSTYYDQPFELKKAAVVKAIAIIRNETATFVSDTTTMVYDYEAWVNLKAAVESGTDLYGRAQGNPNVDTQLLEQLQWALNEGDMIYNNRAQMDSFEATHFTQRINELCAQIEAQMTPTEQVATPNFSWQNDELTISTTTEGADIYYWLSDVDVNGDGVITDADYAHYNNPLTIQRDVTIKAYAAKQAMDNSEIRTLDYPYTSWQTLREVISYASSVADRARHSAKVPDQEVASFEEDIAASYDMYEHRTETKDRVEEVARYLSERAYEIERMMEVEATFVDGVLTIEGNTTVAEALESFGVSTVTESIAAIVYNSSVPMANSDLQAITNPNLLIYVKSDSLAPADRNNIIVDGFAKNIVLTDVAQGNNDFYCPQSFTAEAISYTREFKQKTQIGVSRGWETIALPFNVQTIMHETRGLITPFGNNRSNSHFWLRRLTHDGLQSDSIIEANTAYLISMPNSEEYIADYNLSGRVTFSAENATVPMTEVVKDESADYVMTPCFTNAAAKQGIYVLNVGEQRSGYPEGSIFESNYRALLPFQAYVEHKGSNPAPPFFVVGDLGGDTTGIDATLVNSERENSEAWYTLDGRKLQGKPTQKGVYITNGKKVIIK